MALTKISGSILKDPLNLGEVSIGGTLTYQDVTNVDSVGIITARSTIDAQGDISIADKIIHTGDTNTAIRFPAADTITGETGGSERLRISSNGLVNIGAGSSVSGLSPLLHLHKNASSSTAYLHITNNTTGITNNDGFLLGINGVGDCLVFNKDSTPIRFATQGIERLRITSDGYVGVKRTAPLANLHTTNNELAIGANPTGAAAPNATYDGLVVDGEEASLINIRSCATGNLSYGRVAFSDDVRSRGYIDYRHRDGAGGALEYMNFAVAGSERLRITSSGDLEISTTTTTSPRYLKFNSNRSNADDALGGIYGVWNGNSVAAINFKTGADTTNKDDGELQFVTYSGGTAYERLRITSDGDMGLGTGGNTISQRLDVRESSTTVFNASSNLPTIARLYNTSATTGASAGLQLRTDNNNGAAGIQYIHAVNSSTNYDSDLVFSRRIATSGTYAEACRITNAGNLKFPNGKGIDFSATTNGSGFTQELLDDYEEGNFNGTDVSGGGLTLSYSTTGRYVKVGRQVYVTFDVTYPSTSDTNLSRISPPYTADLPYGSGWVGWNSLGRPMQIHQSGASVYFMDNNNPGTPKHVYNNELSGVRIIGGYMFMTNS